MYEAFYGFKEKPFSMLPDPGFLYLSKKHQTALTLLEYGLFNKVGFCVISGEPGAGKTTVLRAMLERVGNDVSVGLITNTHQSFGGLLDWILSAFDLHAPELTQVEMHQVFMDYLIDEYSKNRSVLLIVDEAQNMNADSLEELRMLSNVNSKKDQLLQIVLVGQPALKDLLRKPELMQFAQRIAVDYHLAPLDLGETCGYIQHRLTVAGAKKDVFTPAACERIFNYSGGTPRLINLLCETVLVFGFADQVEMIDAGLVEEMVNERMKDSVVPFINKDVANPLDAAAIEKLEENFPSISHDDVQLDDAEELQVESEAESELNQQVHSTDAGNADGIIKDVVQNEGEQLAVEESDLVNKENKESPVDGAAEIITGEAIRPATAPATNATDSKETASSPLVKYGAAALVLVVIVIILAVVFNKSDSTTSGVSDSVLLEQQEAEAEQKKIADEKRIQEAAEKLAIEYAAAKEKLEKEQAEIEKLKQDKINKKQAAIVAKENKAKEKKAKQKKAKEKKAREQKAKKKRAEEKRAEEKRKEQEAEYAEEREKRKAAQLEEAKRIKAEEEARQMERKYLKAEREREAQAASEAKSVNASASQKSGSAAGESATDGWSDGKSVPKKNDNAGCAGPTARFKSSCR